MRGNRFDNTTTESTDSEASATGTPTAEASTDFPTAESTEQPTEQAPGTVVLQQPDEAPPVHYGDSGETPPERAGQHVPTKFEPFDW